MPYTCTTCGREHDELPDIGSGAPHHWADALANDPNSLLTEDLCIIEGRDYFIRGVILIPVHAYEHDFGWGVWVSQKKENFETYRARFDTPEIGPFFGWLCTDIAFYPESTLQLKTRAHFRGDGLRPSIEIGESPHPLYRQQRDGITLDAAWEIVHRYMPAE